MIDLISWIDEYLPYNFTLILMKKSNMSEPSILDQGKLVDSGGEEAEYNLFSGVTQLVTSRADAQWSAFRYELYEKISALRLSEDELNEYLSSVPSEDDHWNWTKKYKCLDPSGYKWFYLETKNGIEAMCVLFHPKSATLENGEIFYVEFVAVAPWNRNSKISTRRYRGIGSKILKIASRQMVDLGLKPGFSLHSLPQAVSYYEGQGMERVKEYDKKDLLFFEMRSSVYNEWWAS